jgi:hypothetical protein
MIHAQLFLAGVRDDGDHGPRFRAAMDAINAATMPDPQVRRVCAVGLGWAGVSAGLLAVVCGGLYKWLGQTGGIT